MPLVIMKASGRWLKSYLTFNMKIREFRPTIFFKMLPELDSVIAGLTARTNALEAKVSGIAFCAVSSSIMIHVTLHATINHLLTCKRQFRLCTVGRRHG